MAFIRLKGITSSNGNKLYYAYLCESRWIKGKGPRQKVKGYIGKFETKSLTKEQTRELLKTYNDECALCKQRTNLVVDHKTPLMRGGSNDTENLQILCARCNNKKGNKTQGEY